MKLGLLIVAQMNESTFSWDDFWKLPIVGILRGFEPDLGIEIAARSFAAGLVNIEVTLNSPDVFGQIRAIRDAAPEGVNVGAGSVVSVEGLEKSLEAGAEYIVAPVVQEDVITRCVDLGVPIFPGAFTPTEVVKAWDLGVKVVKLFPLGAAGSTYLKSVRGPLNHIPMMAVDGVDLENFEGYLKAGACGVGMGSKLFPKDKIEAKDWEWLKDHIGAFRDIYEGFQKA